MYLRDYQRHQLRKIRRGGNYIVHGSRQIGITSMLVNYALTYVGDYPGTEVCFVSQRQDRSRECWRSAVDYIYAGKTGNTAIFDRSLDIVKQVEPELVFNNGSVIRFRPSVVNENSKPISEELLILDTANTYPIEHIIGPLSSNVSQIVIGTTGAMIKNSALHNLYIDSLRGKNNFEYIRLPWEVAGSLKERYAELRAQHSEEEWNHDGELIPRTQ